MSQIIHSIANQAYELISSPEEARNRRIHVLGLAVLSVAIRISAIVLAAIAVTSCAIFPMAAGLFGAFIIWEIGTVCENCKNIRKNIIDTERFAQNSLIVFEKTTILEEIANLFCTKPNQS